MLDSDSLGGAMAAFLTGVAVTSGPWLLTTLVLVLLHVGALGPDVADTERIVTVVYAIVIVLSAPADIVLSRYAADRVYERRSDRIAGPLRRVLACALLAFAVVGAVAMAVLAPPLALAIAGVVLAVLVGGQWLLLSAAGGLSSPGIILRAFAIGAPISVAAAVLLSRHGLGAVGQLSGFAAGQVVTLALLLVGTLRALPAGEDDSASILPAFRDYWLLASASLAFHAGLWIDKLLVYGLAGSQVASHYAAMAALAWLSVVPACAYLFVRVETVFHRRFQAFYRALGAGASLRELVELAAALRAEVAASLRGTAAVQVGVTLVCVSAAPLVTSHLGLGAGATATLAWLLLGAAPQVLALSATLLLYYFDFRRDALIAAVSQLVANAALTVLIGAPSHFLGAGYAAASALSCAVACVLLARRMAGLLERTFQSQPYGSEP